MTDITRLRGTVCVPVHRRIMYSEIMIKEYLKYIPKPNGDPMNIDHYKELIKENEEKLVEIKQSIDNYTSVIARYGTSMGEFLDKKEKIEGAIYRYQSEMKRIENAEKCPKKCKCDCDCHEEDGDE